MRRMRIVIGGGTGFLGVALAETYAEEGHEGVRLVYLGRKTRGKPGIRFAVEPATTEAGYVAD